MLFQHYAISIDRDFDHAFDIAAVNTINTVFDEWCQKQNIPLKNRYQNDEASKKIGTLHDDRFPYVRYSICDDKFRIYQGRCSGRCSYSNSLNKYKAYIDEWMEDARGERNRNDNIEAFLPIKSLLQLPPDYAALFAQFAQERGFFDRPISSEEKQELLDYVSNVLEIRQQQDPTKPYKTLSKAIRSLGYELVACSKNTSSKNYGMHWLRRM